MIKVAIIGATGYTGAELIRILSGHPFIEIVSVTSDNYAGMDFDKLYPSVKGYFKKKLITLETDDIIAKSDAIITALPNGLASNIYSKWYEKYGDMIKDKRLIDLSADFRFDDKEVYEKWYKKTVPDFAGLKRVYGLPEVHRELIKDAEVVGNPGCYPTSVILGLTPALKEGLIETKGIVADSKSGVSGAGHAPSLNNLYAECNESVKAYGVAGHRHTPEIEQEISKAAGEDVRITFTPHLVPMTRGILSTIYCDIKPGVKLSEVREAYIEAYHDEPFVHLLDVGEYPRTKDTYGSNNCHIGMALDEHTGKLIIISAIDNLVKGASGQAVQNLNIMFGLDEACALKFPAVFP